MSDSSSSSPSSGITPDALSMARALRDSLAGLSLSHPHFGGYFARADNLVCVMESRPSSPDHGVPDSKAPAVFSGLKDGSKASLESEEMATLKEIVIQLESLADAMPVSWAETIRWLRKTADTLRSLASTLRAPAVQSESGTGDAWTTDKRVGDLSHQISELVLDAAKLGLDGGMAVGIPGQVVDAIVALCERVAQISSFASRSESTSTGATHG